MISIISRYVGKTVVHSILIVLVVIAGMQSFIELSSQINDIGVQHYSTWTAVLCVFMELPLQLYGMFPMIGFLGCLIGLGRLASHSELLIMQASGVSVQRISLIVVVAASILLVFVTAIGETVAPSLQAKAEMIKQTSTHVNAGPTQLHDLWLHQGKAYLHIGTVSSMTQLLDITRFDVNDDQSVKGYLEAKTAVLDQGHWKVQDASYFTISDNSVKAIKQQTMLGMLIKPNMIKKANKDDFVQQSIKSLYERIQYKKQIGLQTVQERFIFWQRIFQPLTTIIMICLGVPFIFGSLRDTSRSLRLLFGVLIGFLFYMMNQFLGSVALIYQFPSFLAAILPTLLFFFIFLYLLYRGDHMQ